MGKFTENFFCTGKKPGLSHMFPLPNPKMANETWHMLVSVIAPGHHLPRPSRRTPGKFETTKNGSVWMAITPTIAIFPRENDDNLMDFGWISVQARAATGCLDMFGLSDSATLCGNHETLAGPASILSNLNLLPLVGVRLQK